MLDSCTILNRTRFLSFGARDLSAATMLTRTRQSALCKGMINIMECTITSGQDCDAGSSPPLSFGIFHPFLREFQMLCETVDECEEWCKCMSLQDAKVKLDDFELLTVLGQVRQSAWLYCSQHGFIEITVSFSCRALSVKLFEQEKRERTTCKIPALCCFFPHHLTRSSVMR